jgi:hypothetical protein
VCGLEAARRRSVRYFHLRGLGESRGRFADAVEHARAALDAGASLADLRRVSGLSTRQVKALLVAQTELFVAERVTL